MRVIPWPDGVEDLYEFGARTADWKDSPAVVLSSVDDLLRRRGMEIVLIMTEDDSYAFMIEELKEP